MILSNLSKDSSKDTRCDPEFYARNNEEQCRLSLKALDMVDKDLEHSHDTNLKFLDIGCGTGDFTYRWLLPRCPPCARIMAVDSSEEMLSYARKMFVHPRIEYDRMDISGDVDKFIAKYGRFDRIYSFFCLNWVRDQGQAMRNVSRLLSSGGECVLVFPAWSRSRMPWMNLARLNRWRKYKELFEGFVPKSQEIEDDSERLSYIRGIVRSSNMELRRCEILLYKPQVWNATAAIDFQMTLNPDLRLLSPQEKKRLQKDVTKALKKFDAAETFCKDDCIYVVHAKKRFA